jgi:tungstate transport system substrate-binding protein
MKRVLFFVIILLVAACGSDEGDDNRDASENRLTLATTTSTEDSGLLDYILPEFEATYDAAVDVVAVGTGQALEIGRAGDADVVLVHARSREDDFVAEGYADARYDVMYNDFVIVGPSEDPAGIGGMDDAPAALAAIAENESTFVSRGDDSGTHTKELNLWEAADIMPEGNWYMSAGQGMGAVLTIADEVQGYTLSDRATYIARQAEGLSLAVLVEGDERLFNPYGVMAVSDDKLAQTFITWLTSIETQEFIASYEVSGIQLFYPNSDQWNAQ